LLCHVSDHYYNLTLLLSSITYGLTVCFCDVGKHAQLSFVHDSRNKKHISKLLNIVATKLLLKFRERNRTEILNGKYGEDDKRGSDICKSHAKEYN